MRITEGMALALIIGCSVGIIVWIIGLVGSLIWAYGG